eukprot:scaffold1504_cov417-Prasinococcus_capsulatus_cf.AAC.46
MSRGSDSAPPGPTSFTVRAAAPPPAPPPQPGLQAKVGGPACKLVLPWGRGRVGALRVARAGRKGAFPVPAQYRAPAGAQSAAAPLTGALGEAGADLGHTGARPIRERAECGRDAAGWRGALSGSAVPRGGARRRWEDRGRRTKTSGCRRALGVFFGLGALRPHVPPTQWPGRANRSGPPRAGCTDEVLLGCRGAFAPGALAPDQWPAIPRGVQVARVT